MMTMIIYQIITLIDPPEHQSFRTLAKYNDEIVYVDVIEIYKKSDNQENHETIFLMMSSSIFILRKYSVLVFIDYH